MPRVSSQTIVGRDGPLRQLDDALAATPQIVLVTGEAGVGKTRLVQELERRARGRGFLVLHGESIEFGGEDFPFAPLAAALRDQSELAELLPAGASGQYGKARLCELVLDLLGGLGHVLLVLEDLHWADRSTRDFLAFAGRRLRDEQLVIVATHRTGELPPGHPLRRLLTELTRRPIVTRLDLSPLDRDAVALQLEAIAGGPVPARLADELHARSGGNPFFVEELFAARRDDAVLSDTVLARVRRLSPPAQRLITVLAAAGGPADEAVLESIVPELGPALREALDAGLVVEGVALRHGLIGEVIYGTLVAGERTELHRALAEALAATGASAARLADQWHRAGDRDASFAASLAAADEAEAVYAYPEARRHLERALELSDGDRLDLLSRAAQAARFDGDRERALELGRQALERFDATEQPARAARLYERLGEYESWDDRAALAYYEQALVLLPAEPSPERSRLLAAQGHALMGLRRWEEARVCCEAALAQGYEAAGLTLGLVLAFLGDFEAGERAVRGALEAADGEDAARAHVHLGELQRLAGRHAAALETMVAGERIAAGRGLRGTFGHFMFVNAADDLMRLGRWDEAEARMRDAERMALGVTASAMHRATAGHLHALRGEAEPARRHLTLALELAGEGLPGEFVVPIHTAWAALALAAGDAVQARRQVATGLAAAGEDRDPLYTPALHWLGVRAEAELGEPEAAAALLADLDELVADSAPAPDALAHRATAAAELSRARRQPEPALWQRAIDAWDDLAEPYPAAYARFRAAEALLGSSRRDGAGSLLGAANATLVELGALPLREQVQALARRARLRLDRRPEPVEESLLTRRETDVLRLLADGLTNRQIAERLFISEKTVGTHVAHIFAKLDVHTRVEAASRAQALGVST